jgi:hypothetical protein
MELSEPHVTSKSLNILHRDVRVTKAGIRSVLFRNAAGFAQAIVRRYDAWQRYWPSLALIFRQAAPGHIIHSSSYQTHSHLVLRMSLELVQHLFTRGERTNAVAVRDNSVATAAGSSLREPETSKRAPRSPFSSEIRPVLRVFRRSPAIRTAREVVSSPAIVESAAPRITAHPRDNRSRVADIPAVEVSRLTDQVIQAIDRRIIAQRERLGRV